MTKEIYDAADIARMMSVFETAYAMDLFATIYLEQPAYSAGVEGGLMRLSPNLNYS